MGMYIGIDPGKNGAIAVYNDREGQIEVYDMPTVQVKKKSGKKVKKTRDYDLAKLVVIFDEIHSRAKWHPNGEVIVVLEGSSGMAFTPTMARDAYHESAKTAFEKGRGTGIIEAFTHIFRIPITVTVRPNDWKRALHMANSKLTYKEKKSVSRQFATDLHPELAKLFKRIKDDGRAEAVLLIDWVRTCYKPKTE